MRPFKRAVVKRKLEKEPGVSTPTLNIPSARTATSHPGLRKNNAQVTGPGRSFEKLKITHPTVAPKAKAATSPNRRGFLTTVVADSPAGHCPGGFPHLQLPHERPPAWIVVLASEPARSLEHELPGPVTA